VAAAGSAEDVLEGGGEARHDVDVVERSGEVFVRWYDELRVWREDLVGEDVGACGVAGIAVVRRWATGHGDVE